MISDPTNNRSMTYLVWGFVLLALPIVLILFPDEAAAYLLVVLSAGLALFLVRHFTDEKKFITKLFFAGLGVRLLFGLFVHVFDWREFFGGDARAYHLFGGLIADYWHGAPIATREAYDLATATLRPGWGMNYLVGAIYFVTGKNILAAQSFCAVIGAATAPVVYFCALKVFGNRNVARNSALAIAFFPSFIIWSAQLLKDGLIIFLLVLAITMVLQLQENISYAAIAVLVLSMFGIISLRFYIFYMVAVAVAGSFLIGVSTNSASILKRSAILIVIAVSLTYLGVIRNAEVNLERYGDLERLQYNRLGLARDTGSGYNEDVDISTTEGAISTIPIGFAYLMLAPFPWEMTNFRQAITLPEVLAWWAMIPLLISGLIFSFRHRLRSAFPILIFSLLLTLSYSIFQGNVGTAYRQRTQIQVFLFIFIAVGWELWREKREDRRTEKMLREKRFDEKLRHGSDVLS